MRLGAWHRNGLTKEIAVKIWNGWLLSISAVTAASLMGGCGTGGPSSGSGGIPGDSGGSGVGGNGAPVGGATASGGTSGTGSTNAGGAGPGNGGSSTGAAPNVGGTNAGGSAPAGGDGSTSGGNGSGGGAPVERPSLVTSGEGDYWKVGELTAGSGQATITVNPSSTKQKWIGFGGTFNEAGWDALSVLSEADRARAIALLFSAADGANFKWGRVPIGASDYAIDRYTLNENKGDYSMSMFSIARDQMRLIPYIHAAQAVKSDIKFWASPWTPPSWMKEPEEIDATDAGPNGQPATYTAYMKDDDPTLEAYALYFVKFVQAYAGENIVIDHVQPQNEPDYATRYPSCRWASGLLGKFVGDFLGPAFEANNLETDIWFGTLSNNDDAIYGGHIGGLIGGSANPDALGYVTGVGLQWNTIGRIPSILSAAPDLLVLQTEHRCGNYPFTVAGAPAFNPDKPQNDYAYAIESWGYLRDWIKAGANGYSAWNMVLDTIGKSIDAQRPWPQNALLTVDRQTQTLTATPAYYVFRHLSYFVDPEATRVDVTGGDAVAFKNPDGSLVAVVYNSANQATSTTVAMGTSTFTVQVPGRGWATLHFKG
jgi:glucosylceramidase